MKLSLLLPNLREEVTVSEIRDLALEAERLEFESLWALDRVVVPEASDREELKYPFGFMEGLAHGIPVSSRGDFLQGWPIIAWLAGITKNIRIGMGVSNAPYRSATINAVDIATIDNLSNGRINVGVGSGWMIEEFQAVGAAHLFDKRNKFVRETLEIMHGVWDKEQDIFEYHGEFYDFGRVGFGAKPVQNPHPPIYDSSLKSPAIAAKRVAKYNIGGWLGVQDAPEQLTEWRGVIAGELENVGRSIDDLDIASMMWLNITEEESDQTLQGKGSNLLVGTEKQVTENLKRLKEAGLDTVVLWPPFRDVSVSKTLDDMKRVKEDILPKVNES